MSCVTSDHKQTKYYWFYVDETFVCPGDKNMILCDLYKVSPFETLIFVMVLTSYENF